MGKRILIAAGEVSGDRHAAHLVAALKQRAPEWEFVGIGGDQMHDAGVELLHHISQLAFLGFVEIIKHIPFIRRVFGDIKDEIRRGIDAAILVDYPGFNLRLARMLKKEGIPVIYYICPQMWAWGEKRIEKFRKYIDLPLVIFKFEEAFFEKHGLKAHFVGHPLLDQIPPNPDDTTFFEKHGIAAGSKIIGLFPGSRAEEVKRILPIMVQAVGKIEPEVEVYPVIARAAHLDIRLYETYLPQDHGFKLIDSDIYHLMRVSYAALVASGTATLELGYFQTPSIVLYVVSPLTYWLARYLIRIDNIALANIVMGKTVFPEYIQSQARVDNIAAALRKLLSDAGHHAQIKNELAKIKQALGAAGAAERAAGLIFDFMGSGDQ